MADSEQINPGNWIGVFGGGQLGRMFTHAAQRLGYHVAVWEPEAGCPAGQVADLHIQAVSGAETQAARDLSTMCRAVTVEFENINATYLDVAAQVCAVRPNAEFLRMCQDRVLEKSSLSNAGFPTTPFLPIQRVDQARAAFAHFGHSMVLKTATSGYDGKGQVKVEHADRVDEAFASLRSNHVIAEKCISFRAELSMILARNGRGQVACYPLFENEHANHILDVTSCPVNPELVHLQPDAEEICRGIASRFKVEGLFCVEFFVDMQGRLMINEVAPRPHNSGHLTMEAFDCSQFEQQVRAVCNLPLIRPEMVRPAAMANLLGDVWSSGEPRWDRLLERGQTHLHLYGKNAPRPGRKMGHVTVLADDVATACHAARSARQCLNPSSAHDSPSSSPALSIHE